MINAADPDFRPLVQAALETAARYGELAHLEVRDFNPDAGTVTIRISKTDKVRHIILTDEGTAFFRWLCAGRGGHQPMLTRADGSDWKKSDQKRPMADAVARARISPPITFHGLRHTWASHAVMNGVPLMVVAKNLGHVDTTMVGEHYGHMASSYIADAIRAGSAALCWRDRRDRCTAAQADTIRPLTAPRRAGEGCWLLNEKARLTGR